MRQVQESPTDYQGEYEYANPRRHCRENVPQKTHLAEQHISKKPSVLNRHLDCRISMRGPERYATSSASSNGFSFFNTSRRSEPGSISSYRNATTRRADLSPFQAGRSSTDDGTSSGSSS